MLFTKYLIASTAIFSSALANSCGWTTDVASKHWTVVVDKDTTYNTGGCGSGCLDNLRGRCGTITSWGCTRNGAAGTYTFATVDGCTAYDVTQALSACTSGTTIDCSYTG